MTSIKTILENGILTITLSRPEALNALNKALLYELETVILEAQSNSAVRGIIVTGEGEKAFVAGADIKEFTALTQTTATELSRKGQALFKLIEDCEKPVIAAVNGFALGGGCELAMACHLRVATENAKFGQPEVNLGIIPGYGGTQRLTQLVGRGKALELLMTGDLISAQEAKSIGLVNHVVGTHAELHATVNTIMNKIISKGAIALSGIIKSVNAGFAFESDGYQAEIANFSTCTGTEDFKEGAQAFIEKRKPNFKGH
jgi:enoyl-CoA hydratase